MAERVLAGGEPVVTISARDDTRLAEAVSVHQLMIQSIACVPICGAPPLGRTIGALYVETRLRAGVRFEQELPTLRAFADQAAIAIENARACWPRTGPAPSSSRPLNWPSPPRATISRRPSESAPSSSPRPAAT